MFMSCKKPWTTGLLAVLVTLVGLCFGSGAAQAGEIATPGHRAEVRNLELNAPGSGPFLEYWVRPQNVCPMGQDVTVWLTDQNQNQIGLSQHYALAPKQILNLDARAFLPPGMNSLAQGSMVITSPNDCLTGEFWRVDGSSIATGQLTITEGGQCVTTCSQWVIQYHWLDAILNDPANITLGTNLLLNYYSDLIYGGNVTVSGYTDDGNLLKEFDLPPSWPHISKTAMSVFNWGAAPGSIWTDFGKGHGTADADHFTSKGWRGFVNGWCIPDCLLGRDRCGVCGGDGSTCGGGGDDLTCTPSSTTALINQQVTFTASGCSNTNYSWTGAPTASPPNASGATYTVKYPGAGVFTNTVSCDGRQAACTVTVNNNPPPSYCSINVIKNAVGGNGTFSFSGNAGSFSIATANNTGSHLVSNLTPGTYSITETVPSGWTKTGDTCQNVQCVANQQASCTVTNTKNGTPCIAITSVSTSSGFGSGKVGVPYSGTITVRGGTQPFTVTGVPAGLSASVNGATITVSGTPTAPGTFTLTVHNGAPCGHAFTVTICIAPGSSTPLSCSPANTSGTAGQNITFTGTGGVTPYSWTSSGTPGTGSSTTYTTQWSTAGSKTVTLRDRVGTTKYCYATITSSPPCTALHVSPSNSSGTVGQPFSLVLSVSGSGPVTATGLPPGLTYNDATHTISGTPTSSGTYTVHLRNACSDVTITICINPGHTTTTGSCSPGYWKNHPGSWGATGYSTGQKYNSVFGVNDDPSLTLMGALNRSGGGKMALGRHAVSALLGASYPGLHYPLSAAQVIAIVQNAFATGNYDAASSQLEANEEPCPLN